MAVLATGTTTFAERRFGVTYHDGVRVAGAVLGLCWAWLPVACRRRAAAQVLGATLAASCAVGVFASAVLLPPVASMLSARDLAAALNGRPRFPRELWVADDRVGSVIFYLTPRLRAGLTTSRVRTVGLDTVLGMRHAAPDTLIAIRQRRLERLASRIDLSGVPFERAGPYRLYAASDWQEALPGSPRFRPKNAGPRGD